MTISSGAAGRRAAPDPGPIRVESLDVLAQLGLPLPPPNYPLVWDPGDKLDLRPCAELEARLAILNVVLARSFGMPAERAIDWLIEAHLMEHLTDPERRFVDAGEGDHFSFALHFDAIYALAWIIGITPDLDPLHPPGDGLVERLPNLPKGERFTAWRLRTLTAPREPGEVAALLDLYYCLDWAYLESERQGLPLPGLVDANAVGQRRWALEWAVVFDGPHHDVPVAWAEIDLSV